MNADHIKSMFEALDDETLDLVCRNVRKELTAAIVGVNAALAAAGLDVDALSPRPELIMRAFELCPLASTRVVLIGQDPYIKPGQAQGLSFSVPYGFPLPPSLRAIYKVCGVRSKSGDLTHWAQQGVLLLNSALTTVIGKSNAHAKPWAPWSDGVISALGRQPRPLIFILLGAEAQKKAPLIAAHHHVLMWGHPSPMADVNRRDCPENFKNCTVFRRTNEILVAAGQQPICWDVHGPSPTYVPDDTLWVFTDGAATGNGRTHCQATWGVYIVDGGTTERIGGEVPPAAIDGKKYNTSNNRGELLAMYEALKLLDARDIADRRVRIVSDSSYVVGCATEWPRRWKADPSQMKGKMNLDLVIPMYDLCETLKGRMNLEVEHMYTTTGLTSHSSEPDDRNSVNWFYWYGNSQADAICNEYKEKKN